MRALEAYAHVLTENTGSRGKDTVYHLMVG